MEYQAYSVSLVGQGDSSCRRNVQALRDFQERGLKVMRQYDPGMSILSPTERSKLPRWGYLKMPGLMAQPSASSSQRAPALGLTEMGCMCRCPR
jgi:hypothetical protein